MASDDLCIVVSSIDHWPCSSFAFQLMWTVKTNLIRILFGSSASYPCLRGVMRAPVPLITRQTKRWSESSSESDEDPDPPKWPCVGGMMGKTKGWSEASDDSDEEWPCVGGTMKGCVGMCNLEGLTYIGVVQLAEDIYSMISQ